MIGPDGGIPPRLFSLLGGYGPPCRESDVAVSCHTSFSARFVSR